MRNILLTIEYAGTNYHGWQRQKGYDTVQQRIEDVLSSIANETITLFASGRTDEGVHSIGQTAHFMTNSAAPLNSFVRGVNTYLPKDITIKSAKEMPLDFHARYSAESKTYIYRLYVSKVPQALKVNRAMHVLPPFDIERAKQACGYFMGKHDFSAFMSKGSSVKSTVRTIKHIDIYNVGDEIELTVTADGFLYNMVRVIVACLVKIAKGKAEPHMVEKFISDKDRSKVREIADAGGLYLKEVKYNPDQT